MTTYYSIIQRELPVYIEFLYTRQTKNPASPLHDSNAATGGVRRSTIPSAAKTAHAGIIPPHMSGFLAVVDFLALDFLRHRGKRPCCALLGVQFFAGFLAELGAGGRTWSCLTPSFSATIMKKSPTFADRGLRGLYWTRTSDPIDVNDVLYQLSQQTTCTRRFIRRQEIVYHTFAPLSRGVGQVFDFFRGAMSVLATGKRAAGSPGGACCW